MKGKSPKLVVGPTLLDLQSTGLAGEQADFATAFYTRSALSKIEISAKNVRFFCRLDMIDLTEWIRGYIAPDALLELSNRLTKQGSKVEIFVAPNAHAKVFLGSHSGMLGSANLTLAGFGAGLEIVDVYHGKSTLKKLRRGLTLYSKRLTKLEIGDLEKFVASKQAEVADGRKIAPPIRDHLPNVLRDTLHRFGDYQDFLNWLAKQKKAAAIEILARAHGKGQLSGHIYRNFYGLRQFLLANPNEMKRFGVLDEDIYKLSRDAVTESSIADFVAQNAVDESNFKLRYWKTYLPKECGGRAGKHGGTIGNLNRMLPLVARYLIQTMKRYASS